MTYKVGRVGVVAAIVLLSGQWAMADFVSTITASSPANWWQLNETSGGTAAAAAGGIALTHQNAGTNTLVGQAGTVGGAGNQAVYLDGTAGAGLYGNSPAAYANPTNTPTVCYYNTGLSIEVWAKSDGLIANVDAQRFVATREFGLGFETNVGGNGNGIGNLMFTTFGVKDYYGVAMPQDGKWHQIGVSWDGSTASFYLDGVAAGSQSGPSGLRAPLATGANSMNLGHRNTDIQHFKGWLDEVVIWDHTRTAEEFSASYAAAVPEPATMSLLVLGGVATLIRRRNRR